MVRLKIKLYFNPVDGIVKVVFESTSKRTADIVGTV